MSTSDKAEKLIEDIVVVIVLYKTTLAESLTFNSLKEAARSMNRTVDLIICDNSPTQGEVKSYDEFHITYLHHKENPGLSAAYNHAAKLAAEMGKTWLLVFDQDTTLPVNALHKYVEAIDQHPTIGLFTPVLINKINHSIISPSLFKFRRGSSPSQVNFGINSLKDLSPVNSGICIRLSLFNKVSGYNELIPLDYSDFDFIQRLSAVETKFYIIDVQCQHSLSSSEKQSLESARKRFDYLCLGLKLSSQNKTDLFFSLLVAFRRATKLTWVYKSSSFFKIMLNGFR